MTAAIAGIAAWYPDEVRTNAAWPSDFGTSSRVSGDRLFNDIPSALDAAARVTDRFLEVEASDPFLGVTERRVASETTSAVDAEVTAGARALEDAGLTAEDIDAVISYAAVPDRITPASACAVAARLGASRSLAFGIDAACASALVQIATAQALVDSGQAKHVLLTQSHLMLRTFPMLHPAAPGLGDAATAVVVSRTGRWPIVAVHGATHGTFNRAVTWVRGQDDATDVPWWRPGGDLRVGTRDRDQAKALQRDTVSYGAQTIAELTRKAGVDLERIGLLASVQPRGWVPEAVAQVLGLKPEVASSVYETRGHLGACGPIANLESAYRHGRTRTDSLAALYAQGAGFTRAGLLLRMDLSA